MTLLSVVIANYNYGRFLEDAINSVLSQDGGDEIELIIVDGGSSDCSVEIIKKYSANIAWWVSEHDNGQSAAFNKGFSHATGRFLTWLNADDVLLPGVIPALKDALAKNPGYRWFIGGGMVWCNQNFIVEQVAVAHRFSRMRRNARNLTVAGPSSFFRADLLKEVGGVDEGLHYVMDIDLWIKFSLIAHEKYERLKGFTWAYRNHAESKMSGPVVDPNSAESRRKRGELHHEQEVLRRRYGDGGLWRYTKCMPVSIADVFKMLWYRNKYNGRSVNFLAGKMMRKPRVLLSNSFQEYITGLLKVPARVYTFNTFYRKKFSSDGDLVVLDDALKVDAKALAAYIDANSIEVLYAQGFGSLMYYSKVRRLCKKVRPRLFVTCHSPEVWDSRWKSLVFVVCASILSDGIVFLVERTRRKWRFVTRLFGRKTWHIQNAIDLARFKRKGLSRKLMAPVFGVIGVLSPRKRQDLIVKLVERLREVGVDASLRIAGDVSKGQDAYAAQLKQYVVEHGLEATVRFDGRIDYDEVPNWFRSIDVYVCASDGEVMPFSILEAMATGLPVVAHDIAGIHEQVVNNENGFLIRSESVAEYADAVEKILSDYERFSRASRKRAEDSFAMNHFADAMREIV